MKKIISILLFLFVSVFAFGCKEKEKTYLLTPEGIPLVAIGGVVSEFEVTTTPGPQVLQSELVQDNYDVIVAPVTLGAQLSIKGSINYKIAGLITFDNMYIVSKKSVTLNSINDLNGKTIYAYGQNQPSDIMLKYALEKSGVTCTIEYADSVATVVSSYFLPGNADYALVAEPYLSKIKQKVEVNVIDVASVLRNLSEGNVEFIPQAAIYVYKELSKSQIKKILKVIEDNIAALNKDNFAYAKLLLEQDSNLYPLFTNLGEDVLSGVCLNAGINYLKAYDNKAKLEEFFGIVDKANKNLFNGQVPSEDFYFKY
ncbi:MAG: ABC transporter substrate-binding protein [Bacilli bacterium]|nr:ABC transporter substrate-binding protein [Bacilli bacterium]